MPVRSTGDKHTKTMQASAPAFRETNSEGLAHSRGVALNSWLVSWLTCGRPRLGASRPRCFVVCRHNLRSEPQIVGEDAEQTSDHGDIPDPLQRPFPKADHPGNVRVLRQAAVEFGAAGIVEDIDNVSPSNSGWIIDSSVLEARIFPKLLGTRFAECFHLRLRAKMQAAGRASFDAGGFQPLGDPVHTECAFEDLSRRRTEFRDIKWAAGDAISAADAMLLLEIDDAIDVLDDGAIRGTRDQASRLLAVHALILTHQKLQSAILALVLVELDQVPIVPLRFRHGLVGIVEGGLAKGETVPFQAGNLAGFAADTGGGVNQLANCKLAPDAGTRDGTSVS